MLHLNCTHIGEIHQPDHDIIDRLAELKEIMALRGLKYVRHESERYVDEPTGSTGTKFTAYGVRQ